MIAAIPLTVLCLSLLGALIYQQIAHAKQTQHLLDRIVAPEVDRARIVEESITPEPYVPNYYEEPVIPDSDLSLDELIKEIA